MNNEKIIKDKALLDTLEAEYTHVRNLTDSVRTFVTDLNFEDNMPDPKERYLMREQLNAYEQVQANLCNRIRFYRARVKANKPEPWEGNEAVRTVDTPCGPVNLVNQDKVSKEELGEMTHHCGQDAKEESHVSLEELLGMEVVAICGSKTKCEGCARGNTDCVKVELVGGTYLCLDNQTQEGSKPVISFDEEDDNKGLLDIMAEIKEKADNFMDYLDTVVINPQKQ